MSGIIFMLLSYFIFSLIEGMFGNVGLLFSDMLMGLLIGMIFAMIAANFFGKGKRVPKVKKNAADKSLQENQRLTKGGLHCANRPCKEGTTYYIIVSQRQWEFFGGAYEAYQYGCQGQPEGKEGKDGLRRMPDVVPVGMQDLLYAGEPALREKAPVGSAAAYTAVPWEYAPTALSTA